MSKRIDTNREELQEMAKTILSEIYSVEKSQNKFESLDSLESEGKSAFRFDDNRGEVFERQYSGYENEGSLQRKFGEGTDTRELNPRRSREELLGQRIERRKRRGGSYINFGNVAAETESDSIKQTGILTQADLPEKLSDIFCRDARRYDGAYERY